MPPSSRPALWSVVAMHAVPALGVLLFGWSLALVLLFYWLENLVSGLIWHRAIRRHHDRTGMRGHYRNQLGVSSGNTPIDFFPAEYRAGALLFTAIHGVFIAVFAFGLLDGAELLANLPWIAVVMAASILLTWEELRPLVRDVETRSFHWLRTQASQSLYQVQAMHVGVILGGLSLTLDEGGLLLVFLFIALRIVADVLRSRPAPLPSQRRPPWYAIYVVESDQPVADRKRRAMEEFQRQLSEDELPRDGAG